MSALRPRPIIGFSAGTEGTVLHIYSDPTSDCISTQFQLLQYESTVDFRVCSHETFHSLGRVAATFIFFYFRGTFNRSNGKCREIRSRCLEALKSTFH